MIVKVLEATREVLDRWRKIASTSHPMMMVLQLGCVFINHGTENTYLGLPPGPNPSARGELYGNMLQAKDGLTGSNFITKDLIVKKSISSSATLFETAVSRLQALHWQKFYRLYHVSRLVGSAQRCAKVF